MRTRNFIKAVSLVLTTSIVLSIAGAMKSVAAGITLSGTSTVQKYGSIDGAWDNSSATLTLKSRPTTDDPCRQIEAINVSLNNTSGTTGSLRYSVYVQGEGWQEYKTEGNDAGIINKALKIEAIKMELTGDLASSYFVEYSVVYEKGGSAQGFVSDGAVAGTIGESKKIESIKIRIVPVSQGTPAVNYRVHSESSGWGTKWAKDGVVAGAAGKGKQIDSIELTLTGCKGDISYCSKVQDKGWESDWSSNGNTSGTLDKRIEAIKIKLLGDIAGTHNVYYRVCVQSVGWLGWANNGEETGVVDLSYKLEALQVVIVKKSDPAPGNVGKIQSIGKLTVITSKTPILPGAGLFEMGQNAKVSYAVKTADGWSKIVSDGKELAVSGEITGIAVGVKLPGNNRELDLWVDMPDFGNGKSDSTDSYDADCLLKIIDARKRIENLEISLYDWTYSYGDQYSIFYRVRTSKLGWMAWAGSGNRSGTDEIGNTISAIQIVVLPAGQTPEANLEGITSAREETFLEMSDFPKQKIITTNNAFAKWCLKNFPESKSVTNYINSNYHKRGYYYYQISSTWPYKLGGKTKKSCDCTGFAVWLFDKYFHKKIKHNSHYVAFKIGKVISYKNIKPGDLLCDCTTYHGDIFFYCGKDEYGHDIIFDGMTPKINGKIKYVVPCFRYIDLADWASKSKHYVKRR